jgi:hypothetical protein
MGEMKNERGTPMFPKTNLSQCHFIHYKFPCLFKGKGKAIPLQALAGP